MTTSSHSHARGGPSTGAVRKGSEDAALLDEPESMLRETLQISPEAPAPIPLIREIVTKNHPN